MTRFFFLPDGTINASKDVGTSINFSAGSRHGKSCKEKSIPARKHIATLFLGGTGLPASSYKLVSLESYGVFFFFFFKYGKMNRKIESKKE